jgi:hypothetical protein
LHLVASMLPLGQFNEFEEFTTNKRILKSNIFFHFIIIILTVVFI